MIARRPLCCTNLIRDSVDEHRFKTASCHQCFADSQLWFMKNFLSNELSMYQFPL